MSARAKWKVLHVKNRLGELLSREGGISRDEATSNAMLLIEELRESCESDICGEIARLEATFRATAPDDLRLATMLKLSDGVLTLAGTFGFGALDQATKCLCDLVAGMMRQGIFLAEPIRVHVEAMRLFAPGSAPLGAEETAHILEQLERVLGHFGFERANMADAAAGLPIEAM